VKDEIDEIDVRDERERECKRVCLLSKSEDKYTSISSVHFISVTLEYFEHFEHF